MRLSKTRSGLAVAVVLLGGCGGGSADRASREEARPAPPGGTPDAVEMQDAPPGTVTVSEPKNAAVPLPAVPMIVEGYQVVRVIVRNTGYEPDRIQLAAGKPAKFVFVQEANSHCASQIQIPAFGVPVTDLPQGKETVVEFTPTRPGEYEFTCGMDMLRGKIHVTS